MKEGMRKFSTFSKKIFELILNFIEKKPFLATLFLNILIFTFFFFTLNAGFNANDDFEMLSIVSGIKSEPSEMMVFTNIIIGKILVNLYKFNIHIPWYSLYLIFGIFLSNLSLVYLLFKINKSSKSLIFALLLSLFFISISYLQLQFTMVSGLLTLSGISILLFSGSINFEKKLYSYSFLVFGLCLFIFGTLIRFDNLYLVIMLFLPFILILIINHFFKNKIKKMFKTTIFIIITLVVSFLLKYYNDFNYNNDYNYKNYLTYNNLRGKLQDNQILNLQDEKTIKNVLKSIGWSENDYNMLLHYFFYPNDVFSSEKLNKIVNHQEIKNNLIKYYINKLLIAINHFPKIFLRIDNIITIFLFIISILIYHNQVKNKYFWFFIIWAILVIILVSTLTKPIPLRVLYTILSFLIFMPINLKIISNNKINNNVLNKKKNTILIILSLLLVIFGSIFLWRVSNINKIIQKEFIYFTEKLSLPINYVNKGGSYPFQYYPPYMDISKLKNFSTIGLGWGTAHPANVKIFSELNIQDIHLDLIYKKDLFLITIHDINDSAKDIFKIYMKEHYNLDIGYYLLADLNFPFDGNRKILKPYAKEKK